MSSNPFSTPFALAIKPSFQKWLFLIAPHLIILILILFASSLSWYLKGSGIILVVFSFVYYYRLYIKANLHRSVISIRQDSAKNWGILLQLSAVSGSKEYINVSLMPASFYSNFLIILIFSDLSQRSMVKARYSVFITPDSVSEDEFRRLKVRLKTIK